MSARLPPIAPEALSAEQRAVLDVVQGTRGRIPTPYRVWIHSPQLARRLQPLGSFLSGGTSLGKAEIEIAVLFLARHWCADYMFAVHAREAHEADLEDGVIAALDAGTVPVLADPRQASVYAVVAALAETGIPSDAVFDAAVSALGHNGIAELLALCGYFTSVGLAMKLYGTALPGSGA